MLVKIVIAFVVFALFNLWFTIAESRVYRENGRPKSFGDVGYYQILMIVEMIDILVNSAKWLLRKMRLS